MSKNSSKINSLSLVVTRRRYIDIYLLIGLKIPQPGEEFWFSKNNCIRSNSSECTYVLCIGVYR